jgi:transcription elongation factor GreA-like protein
VESYKTKYKDHSKLNSCLEESSLTSGYTRDVLTALEEFEKNISFDKGHVLISEIHQTAWKVAASTTIWW